MKLMEKIMSIIVYWARFMSFSFFIFHFLLTNFYPKKLIFCFVLRDPKKLVKKDA